MDVSDNVNKSNVPTVPEYFKNKTIFITGGSGFMGQALVEKLLYSCPDLDRIYLLMRPKKGLLPNNRLEKLFSSSCFDRLRKEKPTIFHEKVHFIAGNVLNLGLGLSDEDRALLIDKVDVVFHSAASLRFDDPLSFAVKSNLRGTRELIALAKHMKHLSSFIHVSTCYCNYKYEVIDEVLYPPAADWREVLDVCDKIDEETLRILTPKYLNGIQNTYLFTKQLAEHLVNEERGRLPVAIVRPSVVVASKEEPAPGWINNLNGPYALFLAVGKGIKYSVYGSEDAAVNYIPVDLCIKHFIVTAWALGTSRLTLTNPFLIFNCVSNEKDLLTNREIIRRTFELHQKWPFEEILWYPKLPVITNNFVRHYLITIICVILPAIMIDSGFKILGKKPRLLKLQRIVYAVDLAVNHFMSRNWKIVNKNFLEIRQLLNEEDTKAFHYRVEKLFEDDKYIETGVIGGKKYLMNENLDDLSRAKKIHFRMKILDRVCRIIFYGIFLWMIISNCILFLQKTGAL